MKAWFCDNLDWFCSVTSGSENYSYHHHSAPEIHGGALFPAFITICIVLLVINDEILRNKKKKGNLR